MSSYDYGWRVLGVDENTGGILLIAEEFIGPDEGGYVNTTYNRTYYYLQGKAGYANGIDELNKICSMYGQGKYTTGGRSITVEDVNKITGYDPETAKYGEGYICEFGNKVTFRFIKRLTLNYSGTNGVSGSSTQIRFDWFDERTRTWESLSSDGSACAQLSLNFYSYNVESISGLDSTEVTLLFGTPDPSTADSYGTFDWISPTGGSFNYYLGSCTVGADMFDGYGVYDIQSYYRGSVAGLTLCESGGGAGSIPARSGVRPVVSLLPHSSLNYNSTTGEWDIAK